MKSASAAKANENINIWSGVSTRLWITTKCPDDDFSVKEKLILKKKATLYTNPSNESAFWMSTRNFTLEVKIAFRALPKKLEPNVRKHGSRNQSNKKLKILVRSESSIEATFIFKF